MNQCFAQALELRLGVREQPHAGRVVQVTGGPDRQHKRRHGFVGVAPWGRRWLVPEPGARLVARAADLDGCRAP